MTNLLAIEKKLNEVVKPDMILSPENWAHLQNMIAMQSFETIENLTKSTNKTVKFLAKMVLNQKGGQ